MAWLEDVAGGGFPRVALNEEGAFTELHTFPVRQDIVGRLELPSSPCSHVRLLAVQVGVDVPKVTLDVVIPRRALVRSVYRGWLAARDDDPARFDREWLKFGEEPSDPGSPFARSPLIEGWLAKPEAPDG